MPDKNIVMYRLILTAALFLLFIHCQSKILTISEKTDNNKNSHELSLSAHWTGILNNHPDSIHNFNFRYPDGKKGIKPFIAPALLISGGTAFHFMTETKENINDYFQDNFRYTGEFDDYAQYAPLAAVYALKAIGIRGENNFGNTTAIAVKSFLLNSLITDRLKYLTNVERPGGELRSFPSGHTSKAFCLAHLMHREYGSSNIWYSIGAYSCAATVGVLRLAKGAHWLSDVFAGAGIGIISTELVLLTHQYKWDNEHLKRFKLCHFQIGRHNKITISYNF
jgi:membrane-associated phospholipid phosphatase